MRKIAGYLTKKGPKNRPKHTRKRIHQDKKNFLEKFKTASNYLYSRYRFENLPKDLTDKRKPKIVDISKEDAVNIIGDTDLTEGQVKRMINERKVIIAHFLDRGDEWHCFFITYNSIGGKENHKDGQPHFHYISSAFGIKRDDFIKSMESGNYKSTSVHIDLLGYGNQPITNTDEK